MGYFNGPHRDRSTRKRDGERYVRAYKLEKWINRCVRCQDVGYKPDMPDGEHTHYHVRRYFRVLPINELGLCERCQE